METRGKRTGLLVVTGLLALMFVVTGASKLAGLPPSPQNFARWGLSLNFMRTIGALELLGGLALFVPKLWRLAAVGLIALMFGAVRTGVVFHEPLHIFLPSALILLLAVLLFARKA